MQHNYFIAWPKLMKIGLIDVLFAVTRTKKKRLITYKACFKGYMFFFFSVKDRNLFHRVDTIGNITDGVHEMK